MIIFGIDPGTRITGFGLIEYCGNRFKVLDYGVIKPPANAPLEKRYLAIFTSIEHLIESYQPSCLVVETQFVDKNVQSAIKLGMARGVCLLAAARAQIAIKEYSPTMAKKAVVGKGHASKQQMQLMVKKLLQIEEDIKEDAADALALAICHTHSYKRDQLLSKILER